MNPQISESSKNDEAHLADHEKHMDTGCVRSVARLFEVALHSLSAKQTKLIKKCIRRRPPKAPSETLPTIVDGQRYILAAVWFRCSYLGCGFDK